jgi:Tol biopolymer transport system component
MSRLSTRLALAQFVLVGFLPANTASWSPAELVSQPAPPVLSRTGQGDSRGPVVSADGRHVAFLSRAAGVVAGAYNGEFQVYVRDREEQTTQLVSKGTDGSSPGTRASTAPRISADGRWILFQSQAENLVVEETGGVENLFLWDRTSGTTRLVSVNEEGTAGGDNASYAGFMTPDGRWVLFESRARDLVEESTTGYGDVFVRDVDAGVTQLVSVGLSGATGGSFPSYEASISDDGRFVSFLSGSTNLVAGTGGAPYYAQVYRRDLRDGRTECLSVPHDPLFAPDRGADSPVLSAQGGHVVFRSASTNLVSGDPHIGLRLFWREVDSGTTRALDLVIDEELVPSRSPVISRDGEWVAFETGDAALGGQIYLWHALSDMFQLVSVAADGVSLGAGTSHSPVIGPDVEWVTFVSNATNLLNAPTSGTYLVYQRDLILGQTILVSVGYADQPADEDSGVFDVSQDGRVIAFESYDDGLVVEDRNRAYDVFLRDLDSSRSTLMSEQLTAQPSQTPDRFSAVSRQPVSADGRLIVFASLAANLGPMDTNGNWDVYVRDLDGGTNRLVTINTNGDAANGSSLDPVLSADGRYVAFLSDATDLVPGSSGQSRELYLHEVATGATTLITARTEDSDGPGMIGSHRISADGARIVYLSSATNLVQDAAFSNEKPVWNVYLYDRLSGANRLVSRSADGLSGADDDCETVVMSADGDVIVYDTRAGNLVNESLPLYPRHVMVYEVDRDVTWWVHAGGHEPGNSHGSVVSETLPDTNQALTPDGRWLVTHFHTNAYLHDLVERTRRPIFGHSVEAAISPDARFVALRPVDDSGSPPQIVVIDLIHGAVIPVTRNPTRDEGGDERSHTPRWAGNSRFLVFASRASNLVPDDHNGLADVFVRDLTLGITVPLSVSHGSRYTANSLSSNPVLGADCYTLVFESGATDLTDGHSRATRNLFRVRLGLGDSDGDGMDDDWEIAHFGDLSRAGTGDKDRDGDGLSDGEEFRAGTQPNDPLSVVRVSVIKSIPSDQVTLVWPSVPGRTYVIQGKSSLSDLEWVTLSGGVTAGEPLTSRELDFGTSHAQSYYRVVVVVP